MEKKKTVLFETLGCKLNFAESSALCRRLIDSGYRPCDEGEQPDIVIINTCSVTDTADKKGRQLIHRIVKLYPEAFVIVTGCFAQLKPDEISRIPGVDMVLGANEKIDLAERIEQGISQKVQVVPLAEITRFRPECSADDRTRHFLKIQDGCNYYCTYCTIPYARGRSRNASVADTVAVAQQAIDQGAKEIVLTGVNIGDFGRTTGETFLSLVQALDRLDAEVRYRISSIEPDLLTDDIISYVATSRHFAPHFHIPLQAGSDSVLRLMHRRYDTRLFADKVHAIKALMPHAFIGVDVMTGMRGETDRLFGEGEEFIRSLPLSQLHVFTYSERAGTRALEITPIVPMHERRLRTARLMQISEQKLAEFYARQQGRTATVLWEESSDGNSMGGFTENYVRLNRAYDPARVNKFETVKIER